MNFVEANKSTWADASSSDDEGTGIEVENEISELLIQPMKVTTAPIAAANTAAWALASSSDEESDAEEDAQVHATHQYYSYTN